MMNPKAFCRRRGSTLIEVMFTTGIFSVLMLTLFGIVQYGMDSWRSIEGRHVTQTMMRKIGVFAMDDIRRTGFNVMGITSLGDYNAANASAAGLYGEAKLLDGKTHFGQAVWMGSAYNSDAAADSGGAAMFSRGDDGKPQYSRTILYYAALMDPAEHNKKYGDINKVCGGPASCPHKWLIRREIDGLVNNASEIKQYIEKAGPNIFKNNKVKKTQVLADCIVAFRVAVQKPGVTLVIKSARLEEMRRRLQTSRTKLSAGPSDAKNSVEELSNEEAVSKMRTLTDIAGRDSEYTIQYDITVIPCN